MAPAIPETNAAPAEVAPAEVIPAEVAPPDVTPIVAPASNAARLARGVTRALHALGQASLTEFTLRSGRRVDVIGLDPDGRLTIVEIKSSPEDFRADRKWRQYLDYCDRFFFAVAEGFPQDVLPADCGLMIADGYGAAVLRQAPVLPLAAARRRALILRFAQAAAQRLNRTADPGLEAGLSGTSAR
jgi:hypothetical protein